MSGEFLLPHSLILKRRLAAELPLGVFGNGRAFLQVGRFLIAHAPGQDHVSAQVLFG